MLSLTVYAPAFGQPSGSPFAVKAMCMVAQSGQNFEFIVQQDPRKSPKGKFPVLEHDGRVIPDSDQIRDYLEEQFNIDFDDGLSPQERAQSRAVIRMVEEHVYFALLHNRWAVDENWAYLEKIFFADLPIPFRWFLPGMVRKGTVRQTHEQGIGRFSEAEQLERIGKDIAALSHILGDQSFLFGEAPTGADYSVVPVLQAMANFPRETAFARLINEHPNLVGYLERGKDVLYPK